MNSKKTSKFQIPTFQTNDQPRFQQRRFAQDESAPRGTQAKREGKPSKGHFERSKSSFSTRQDNRDDKKFSPKRPRFSDDFHQEAVRNTPITELTLSKSGSKDGQVNVWVKGSKESLQPKVKKTGPLSPRAPEKIKKNRAEEMKVYGENACLALFAQRPERIVRVWTTVNMSHKVGELFSYLAANKKVYHVVDAQELALVSGTEHHGGICMLVKKPRPFTLQGYLDVAREEDGLVLLDGVQNAQNIGGILRTCAYFGVKSIVVENADNALSAAALRVAEGGAEYVRLLESTDSVQALNQLRQAGYQVVHVSANKKAKSLSQQRFNKKVVFVLSEGTTEALAESQDSQVCLSPRNPLKHGLNIAVNAGILLAQWQLTQ